MKVYAVDVQAVFYGVATIRVTADSEDDAIRQAMTIAYLDPPTPHLADIECVGTDEILAVYEEAP